MTGARRRLAARLPRGRLRLAVVLALVLAAMVLAATLSASLVLWRAAQDVTVELVNEAVKASLEEVERGIRDRLDPMAQMLAELGAEIARGRLDPANGEEVEAALVATLAGRPTMTGIALVTPDRLRTRVQRDETGAFEIERAHVLAPALAGRLQAMDAAEGLRWIDLAFVPEARQPVLTAQVPVRRDRAVVAYLIAGVTVADLSHMVDDLAAEGPETPFVLLGETRVIAHPQLVDLGDEAWPVADLPTLDQVRDPVVAAWPRGTPMPQFARIGRFGIEVRRVVPAADGRPAIVATKRLGRYGEQPWMLGTWVPAALIEDAVAPLLHALKVAGGLLVASVVVALLIGRLVAGPIRIVTAGVSQISRLDLDRVRPLPRFRIRELDEQSIAFNAMLATLHAFQAYVPRALVQRLIEAGRADAVPSRVRDLTVMFTDIAGFTSAAEHLPPAEVATFLNRHFALLAERIEAEGGTVDKFLGDGLMAFWGAPERLKGRAARACRAALAIRTALDQDNAARAGLGLAPVRVRVGIHRGPLVVGNIGAPDRLNYTVVGDAANVAQRLEQHGKSIDDDHASAVIVVSGPVMRDAGPGFRFAPLGDAAVKGRDEPVRAFRLVGVADGASAAAPADVAVG